MKRIITILAICMAVSISTFAQTATPSGPQKIGHINSQLLLSIMPEMKKAQDEVKALAKTYQDQLTKMQLEYKTKGEKLQAEATKLSDAIKEVKIKEIQDLEKRIIDLSKSGEKKVAAKEQELAAPIIKKADVAIKAVAKEQGYSFVIDSSTGALLHALDGDNLLKAVKAKLGIK